MTWRVARSLEVLLQEVNAKWPNRSKASDGSIGNAEHSARESDHNPDDDGVVCARDFTNDPEHGLVSRKLAEALIASRDARIKYIISNREICSGSAGPSPWIWRKYTGANAHEHHMHISVKADAAHYDSIAPWNLSDATSKPATGVVVEVGTSLWLQRELNKHGAKLQEDGHEGELTQAATRAYAVEQLKAGK